MKNILIYLSPIDKNDKTKTENNHEKSDGVCENSGSLSFLLTITQVRPEDISRFWCSSDSDSASFESVRSIGDSFDKAAQNFSNKRSLELTGNITCLLSFTEGNKD